MIRINVLIRFVMPALVALTIIALYLDGAHDLKADLGGDATQNFLSAYNFYSDFQYGHHLGSPGLRREPFPNWVLAVFLWIFYQPPKGLLKQDVLSNASIQNNAVHVNLLWLLCLFVAIWILSRQLFKSKLLADLVAIFSILVSYGFFARFELDNLNTELPASVLLVCLSIAIVHASNVRNIWSMLLIGITYGLLVLTKASGAYVAFFTIPLIVLAATCKSRALVRGCLRQYLIFFLAAAIGFFIIVAPWITRNYLEFNRPILAEGGGRVLWIRSEFNKISINEYWGAFYAYSPKLLRESIFEPVFGFEPNQLECGGNLQLHVRGLDCDIKLRSEKRYDEVVSLYERGKKALPMKKLDQMKQLGKEFNVDDSGKQEFFATLKSKPAQHIALTFPLAWRGIWSFKAKDFLGLLLNFLIMINLVLMPLLSLILKNRVLFLLSLIPASYYWFYAFLSQFWERFSEPFIPVGTILFAYSFVFYFSKYFMVRDRLEKSGKLTH
jgi:hypothetical protein